METSLNLINTDTKMFQDKSISWEEINMAQMKNFLKFEV